MGTPERTFEEVVRQLPLEYQAELYDFAEFHLEKSQKKAPRRPNFGWAGALKELRAEYSSVELQHELSSWRVDADFDRTDLARRTPEQFLSGTD